MMLLTKTTFKATIKVGTEGGSAELTLQLPSDLASLTFTIPAGEREYVSKVFGFEFGWSTGRA